MLEQIKADNFDQYDFKPDIFDKLTEIDGHFTLSEDGFIDLDNGCNNAESYINFTFDVVVKNYLNDHDVQSPEITVNDVILGGLSINLYDWQLKEVRSYIDNILVFA